MSSEQFPGPDLLRKISEAAQQLAGFVSQYMPLDNGESLGALPGFASSTGLAPMHPGGPHEPIFYLERLLFRQPGWIIKGGECGGVRSFNQYDPDLFYMPHGTTWGDDVDQAIGALRKHLGAVKWYLRLSPPPSVPSLAVQKDGRFAPEPALPEIRPDRAKPFPADIVRGMRVAAGVLIEAAGGSCPPGGKIDTPVGVTLLDAALALCDGDDVAAKAVKDRWRKLREPKRPDAIGKDPSHCQTNLYEPAAIVAWLKKIQTFDKPVVLRELTLIARRPRSG